MSVANEAHVTGIVAAPERAATERKLPFWQRRAFYRYGFVILVLGLWELLGPLVNGGGVIAAVSYPGQE